MNIKLRLEQEAAHIHRDSTCPEHRAFAAFLLRVADTAELVLKVQNGDLSEGEEIIAINECLPPYTAENTALEELHDAMEHAQRILDKYNTSEERKAHSGNP